jgi:hypothetical protein
VLATSATLAEGATGADAVVVVFAVPVFAGVELHARSASATNESTLDIAREYQLADVTGDANRFACRRDRPSKMRLGEDHERGETDVGDERRTAGLVHQISDARAQPG